MDKPMMFIDFEKWCPKCKYKDTEEYREPCNSCLEVPVRPNDSSPERWEKK